MTNSYAVVLPRIRDREKVPVYQASIRALRVVDPQTFFTYQTTIEALDDAVTRAMADPTVSLQVDRISDPLISQVRRMWGRKTFPSFNPGLLDEVLFLGTGIARVEADSGWKDLTKIHPAIHCTLALTFAFSDQPNPGASVFLDSVFNVARGSSTPQAAFADEPRT
jgi:hypothetical protein